LTVDECCATGRRQARKICVANVREARRSCFFVGNNLGGLWLVSNALPLAERLLQKKWRTRRPADLTPLFSYSQLTHDFVHQSAAVRRFVLSNAVAQYLQRQHGDLCHGRHGMVHFMCYKKRQRQACGVDVVVVGERVLSARREDDGRLSIGMWCEMYVEACYIPFR
jgi:hypothetical protein